MREDGDKLSLALLAYQEEKGIKKRRSVGGLASLLAIVGLGVFLTFFAYLLYDEDLSSGTLTAAREVFSELLDKNEAISVFLGLDEREER